MFTQWNEHNYGVWANGAERRLIFSDKYPKQYVQGSTPLEGRIKQLEEELAGKRRSRFQEIFGKKIGKVALESQKTGCKDILDKLKSEINNSKEFVEALNATKGFDNLRKRIQSAELSELDINDLLDSDLRPFFEDDLAGRLESSAERMKTAANTKLVLNMTGSLFVAQAEQEWKKLDSVKKGELKKREWIARRARELEGEKDAWGERQKLRELASIDQPNKFDSGYLELLNREVEDEATQEEQRRRHAIQIAEKNLVALADQLDYEDKLQITNLLLEAHEIRMERIRSYLKARYEIIKKLFSTNKNLLDAENRQKCEHDLKLYEQSFDLIKTPDEAKQCNQALDLAEANLKDSITGLNTVKSKRVEIEQNIRSRFANLEFQINQFTPERVDAIIEKHRQEEVKRLTKAGTPPLDPNDLNELKKASAIFRKNINALEDMGVKGDVHKHMNEFRVRLDTLGELDLTELQAIAEELETLQDRFGYLDNFGEKIDDAINPSKLDNAKRAQMVIGKLRSISSIEEIKNILEEDIRKDHLEYVSHKDFEKKYRQYTGTGHMVFYERGDEWKIIIDKDALKDEKNIKNLQRQLTHEFLHLQFENHDELKEKWIELCTGNARWPEIKQAFVEAFPEKRPAQDKGEEKRRYTAADWNDEDIISELFAMQNEIGNVLQPGDSGKLAKLRELIAGSGLGARAMGITDEEKAAEIVRGYEGDDTIADTIRESDMGKTGNIEKASESAAGLRKQLEEQNSLIQELLNSEYIDYLPGAGELLGLMQKYNENTSQLVNEAEKNPSDYLKAEISDRIAKVKKDLSDLTPQLAQTGEQIPNQRINGFRNIWNQSYFNSIGDFVQVVVDAKEYFQRRHQRKKKDHAARLGQALFSKIPFLAGLGSEATARQQKAEMEEVNEWKDRYSNQDAWQIQAILVNISNSVDPNPDELKAVLRILAEKGRINWRSEALWKALNKLQNNTHLTPGDPVLLHNPPLLRQKLHSATGQIWDYDEYLSLERQNEDAYESGKKKFEPALDNIQDQLTTRLVQLLRMKREGRNVEPQEFESTIEYCIKNGKSFAENVFFFLVVGMAEGILTPDRGLALDKHLNTWPATQWIYSKSPPYSQKDYQNLCNTYFKNEYQAGMVDTTITNGFMNFFWTQVQNDQMTIDRVRKSVSERNWDHDWGRSIACMGDAHTAKRFLQGKAGQEEAKDTGIENSYVGALQWLEQNAVNAENTDFKKNFARQMAWVAMADGILDSVAYSKNAGANFTRSTSQMMNKKARETGIGLHQDWFVSQHRNKMRNFLDMFDPTLFAMLRNEQMAKENPKGLGELIRNYLIANYPDKTEEWNGITEVDHVFDKLDSIIDSVVSSMPEDQVLARIKLLLTKQLD